MVAIPVSCGYYLINYECRRKIQISSISNDNQGVTRHRDIAKGVMRDSFSIILIGISNKYTYKFCHTKSRKRGTTDKTRFTNGKCVYLVIIIHNSRK